jgi:hypothetical protein
MAPSLPSATVASAGIVCPAAKLTAVVPGLAAPDAHAVTEPPARDSVAVMLTTTAATPLGRDAERGRPPAP